MSYDPSCYELAKDFLEGDDGGSPAASEIDRLAQGIQDYIEDFIHGEDLENEARQQSRQQDAADRASGI